MSGMTVGPLVGGLLLNSFWWGSAFLLGVPFMLLLLVTGPLLLPEHRDATAGRLDLTSVALSLAAILPVIYGLKSLARNGWDALPAAAIVVGLLVGVVFVRRQQRLTSPLLDLRLFASRSRSTSLSIMLFTGVVMAALTLMSSLYLQLVEGLSTLRAGQWLVPQNIAMVAGSLVGPALARKIRPAYVVATGLVIGGCGLFLVALIHSTGGLGLLVTGLILAAGGVALPMALIGNLVIGSAQRNSTPPHRARRHRRQGSPSGRTPPPTGTPPRPQTNRIAPAEF